LFAKTRRWLSRQQRPPQMSGRSQSQSEISMRLTS